MKKTENFDYLLFAGPAKDALHPACAYKYAEDAIEAAKRLEAEKIKKMCCIEVVNMPADDDTVNEIIWTNCGEK